MKKNQLTQEWQKTKSTITEYHIHIYYDNDASDAKTLADNLITLFPKTITGPYSIGIVGPHTKRNIEVNVAADAIGDVLPWLQLNNPGLSILIHPRTGDEVKDHLERSLWLGTPVNFNERFFAQFAKAVNQNRPRI